MPGIEVPDPSSSPLPRPLLRSHKILPRKRDIGPVEFSPQDASPSSGSAIPTTPALPLTPPVVAHGDNSSSGSELQKDESLKPDRRALPAVTPSRAPHVLTPEVTPPRNTPPNRLDSSQSGQPVSSSRAESFRTARETIPSDEDTDASYLSTPSLRLSKKQNAGQRPLLRNEHPMDPNSPHNRPTIFDSHDGQQTNIRKQEHRTEQLDIALTRNGFPSNDDRQNQIPATNDHNLNDPVGNTKKTMASAHVEQVGEDIDLTAEESSTPTERPDFRRLPGTSATSAVEAVIIDSPLPAKRALRHTEKRQSLRSASSPTTISERTSSASNPNSQHRLVHKAARITEQDRKSVASDPSVSASSTLGAVRPSVDVVPVVVIPERRSSLRSSNQNSRNQSVACSRRSSQRTTATSGSRTGSLDRPRRRNRAVSDSTKPFSEVNSRARPLSQPVIPPRSSSLSAPTSRNNSQATSLTSESLRHHTLATDERQAKPEVSEPQAGPSYLHNQEAGDTPAGHPGYPTIAVEDTSDLAPPSLPFAHGSIHSLSPGPVEINEATTVSFFPHNNNSLLVVNQHVLPESRAMQAVRTKDGDRLDDPRTPETSMQALQADFDSPLRNPRPPPKPPVCKALPPAPTEALNDQAEGPNNPQGSNGGLVRRFGSVRRALSARPRSGSFNSVARSFSISAKDRRAEKDIGSSFWWPRGFWDDATDTGNTQSPRKEGSGTRDPRGNQIIGNSLGMPQERLVFEGPSLDRRSPEMRRLVDGISMRHYPSRSNLVGNRVLSPDLLRAGSPLYQRRLPLMSRLRLRLHPIRLRDLRKRMRRSAHRREQRGLEARRETLKQSIGDVVHVGSSA
ncbi:hypothetical protein PHISP_07687 [Aspergillus sp. HF37]|nr:hypothetical protein PHISP_07687 [Aspergillus sp. HF37]